MTPRTIKTCASLVLLGGLLAPLGSAAETTLCIPGIPGPFSNGVVTDCIEVLGFGQDLTVAPEVDGGRTVIDFDTIKVIKPVDQATPLLFISALEETIHNGVGLRFFEECGTNLVTPYRIDLLLGVKVARVSETGGPGLPTEQIELTFSRIRWSITTYDLACNAEGTIERTWDLTTNQML